MATRSFVRAGISASGVAPSSSSRLTDPPAPRAKLRSIAASSNTAWLPAEAAPKSGFPSSAYLQWWAEILLPKALMLIQQAPALENVLVDSLIPMIAYVGLWRLLAMARLVSFPTSSDSLWASTPRLAYFASYAGLFALLALSERLYEPGTAFTRKQQIVLAKSLLWSTLVVVGLHRGLGGEIVLIKVLALSTPVSLMAMIGWRSWRVVGAAPKRTVRNVLIVGAGERGREIAAAISAHQRDVRQVVGFLDNHKVNTHEVLGRFADLSRIARSLFVDEIILAIPDQPDTARWLAHVAKLNRINVTLAADFLGFQADGSTRQSARDPRLLTLHREPIPCLDFALKRGLDLLVSSLALTLLMPALAIIAILVRSDSAGPALYKAPRVGRKGLQFKCLKFRTMVQNADALKVALRSRNEREGPLFKLTADPRITRIGGFLRRYSLDELPQLWNVFTGEMSLVGPRPHPVDDFKQYRLNDMRRLTVTPGITGLWQVTARRDPSFETNMALDVQYIERWTLWLDFKILCKTFAAVWQGSGA